MSLVILCLEAREMFIVQSYLQLLCSCFLNCFLCTQSFQIWGSPYGVEANMLTVTL